MKKSVKSILIAVCALVLVVASVAGTLAYLTAKTETVTNTFAIGKLFDPEDPEDPTIKPFVIVEHKATDPDKDGQYTLGDEEVLENKYTILPGVDVPKDPTMKTTLPVEVSAYVFLEVVDKTDAAVTVTIDNSNWTKLAYTGKQGGTVYVMKANNGILAGGSTLAATSILKDNKLVVANQEIKTQGTVSFYGYMIQSAGLASANAAAVALGFTAIAN